MLATAASNIWVKQNQGKANPATRAAFLLAEDSFPKCGPGFHRPISFGPWADGCRRSQTRNSRTLRICVALVRFFLSFFFFSDLFAGVCGCDERSGEARQLKQGWAPPRRVVGGSLVGDCGSDAGGMVFGSRSGVLAVI